MNENELYHYGVPGMKWGVIRAAKTIGKAAVSSSTKNAALKTSRKIANRSYKRSFGKNRYKIDSKRNLKYDSKISKKVGKLNGKYTKEDSRFDYKTYRAKGVKSINKSMNKGDSHTKAVVKYEAKLAAKKVLTSIGLQAVSTAALGYVAIKGKQYANRSLPRLENVDMNIIDAKFKVIS